MFRLAFLPYLVFEVLDFYGLKSKILAIMYAKIVQIRSVLNFDRIIKMLTKSGEKRV